MAMGVVKTPEFDLSDQTIIALWAEAVKITPEVDEQTWLVTMAATAGWTPEKLAERRVGLQREDVGLVPLGLTRETMGI